MLVRMIRLDLGISAPTGLKSVTDPSASTNWNSSIAHASWQIAFILIML